MQSNSLLDDILKAVAEVEAIIEKRGPEMMYVIQTASGKYLPVQRLSPFYPNVTKEQLERTLTNYRDPETDESLQGSTVIAFPKPDMSFRPLQFEWKEEPLRPREEDDKVTE